MQLKVLNPLLPKTFVSSIYTTLIKKTNGFSGTTTLKLEDTNSGITELHANKSINGFSKIPMAQFLANKDLSIF